jgi:hypothetical protein
MAPLGDLCMDGNGIFAHALIRANSVWKLLGVSDSPRLDENTWEDAPLLPL